jgi:uncharacterized protein YjbI with pentapeptide repeats
MGRIVELPSIKPRSTSRRRGLRKLPPDLIGKARDENAAQVTRIGLTFIGTAAFCLLSLLSPDSALLGGNEKINVPLAGPVSFFGFMLLGPAVLIMLRVYLQIYVEHSDRLDRLARSVSVVRAPTLIPLQNPLIRLFSGLTFYMLLPVTMVLFAWKAAVFPAWGSALLSVAVAVIASHFMLPFSRLSWRQIGLLSVSAAIIGLLSRSAATIAELNRSSSLPSPLPSAPLLDLGPAWGWALLSLSLAVAGIAVRGMLPFSRFSWRQIGLVSVSAAILAGSAMLGFGSLLHRPFDLYHANLSGQWLVNEELPNAYLSFANLSGANLSRANLWRADLIAANLSGAHLSGANLSVAHLDYADLRGANLSGGANLNGAELSNADLSDAHLLTSRLDHANLSGAKLSNADLIGAKLRNANLSGANLSGAKLSTADLGGANLSNADLSSADLSDVHLPTSLRDANLSGGAKLSNADLIGAKLRNANLSNADLSGTKNLTQTQLDEACGNANTKLPEGQGLTLKPCSTD